MALPWKPVRLPRPYKTLETRSGALRFYLGDSLDVMRALEPGSVSAVVTSPPYNLGVEYRSYEDSLPREHYSSGRMPGFGRSRARWNRRARSS